LPEPKIAEPDTGEIFRDYIGYHAHPEGDLVFSNSYTRFGEEGNDAKFVHDTKQALYLGVWVKGSVQIGVCELRACPLFKREGTPPSRTLRK